MISIDKLVDMVATEVITEWTDPYSFKNPNLPPIRYDLQLIEEEDGTLTWEE